jgi:meso-butanediol dehydrogenase / (S,S)-butanediol dehydrogenase / diacetyl reductase
MSRFENKVVVVTGAGSGIGAATAKRFLKEGALVVLNGRRKNKLEDSVSGFPSERVLIDDGDISDKEYISGLVERTVSRFRRLDILVNNAAAHTLGSFANTPEEQWHRIMATNLNGVFYLTRAALPHLLASKGNIVNVSSVSGLGGDWGQSFYNTSKGALSNLTRCLALELGGRGVRANAVNPSATLSEITEGFVQHKILMDKVFDRLPLGRVAMPEEVAAAVAFLASEDASFVNGVNLPVDGGVSASCGQPNATVFMSEFGIS